MKQQLDARCLLCPLPVIRVQDRINSMAAGELLEVVCTDPGAASDIPVWCRINGHKVVEMQEQEGELVIVVEVGDSQ